MACSKGLAAVAYEILTNDETAKAVEDEFRRNIREKAEAVVSDYGVKLPTQQDLNSLPASLPPALQDFVQTPGIAVEQVFGALMATDTFVDRLRGLF